MSAPASVLCVRERIHLSRSVLARYLRTNRRPLKNWKPGRAKQDAHSIATRSSSRTTTSNSFAGAAPSLVKESDSAR